MCGDFLCFGPGASGKILKAGCRIHSAQEVTNLAGHGPQLWLPESGQHMVPWHFSWAPKGRRAAVCWPLHATAIQWNTELAFVRKGRMVLCNPSDSCGLGIRRVRSLKKRLESCSLHVRIVGTGNPGTRHGNRGAETVPEKQASHWEVEMKASKGFRHSSLGGQKEAAYLKPYLRKRSWDTFLPCHIARSPNKIHL